MAQGYSGKEFGCILGIQDISASAIGTAPTTSQFVSGTKVQMRLETVNDIAWDAGYNRTEINRSGNRAMRSEDIINHYGSGVFTWDFEYIVDNEVGFQNLLNLIYPETASTGASTDGMVIPASPTTGDYSHGATAGADKVASIIIQNPNNDDDRLMHSAVLQHSTLSMSADTNGGNLMASGQFMSGYKPVVTGNTFSADTSASDIARGLFDCPTHTIGGSSRTIRSFTITIDNPANRIGYQGSGGEADGYVRAGLLNVTGEVVVKADANSFDYLADWQANTLRAIIVEASTASELSINIPSAHFSGHAIDMAEEGSFISIPFTATTGADSGGNLAVVKFT